MMGRDYRGRELWREKTTERGYYRWGNYGGRELRREGSIDGGTMEGEQVKAREAGKGRETEDEGRAARDGVRATRDGGRVTRDRGRARRDKREGDKLGRLEKYKRLRERADRRAEGERR